MGLVSQLSGCNLGENLLLDCAAVVCQGTADSSSVPGTLFPRQAVAAKIASWTWALEFSENRPNRIDQS